MGCVLSGINAGDSGERNPICTGDAARERQTLAGCRETDSCITISSLSDQGSSARHSRGFLVRVRGAGWSDPIGIRWCMRPVGSSGHKALVVLANLLNEEMPKHRISGLALAPR